MCAHTHELRFVAVLVFDYGDNLRGLEPHVFPASHPEIAYQCALASGDGARPGTFVGLAELSTFVEPIAPVGRIDSGRAEEMIVAKSQLSAFQDPRWLDVPFDPIELESRLNAAPPLFELPRLDDVQWSRLSHAYGAALDVPLHLRRLASSDAAGRDCALWELAASIYHQGDVFDSTAAAIPFLVALASHPSFPGRVDVLKFLVEIAAAAGASTDAERICEVLRARKLAWPEMPFTRPVAEIAEQIVTTRLGVRTAMHRAIDDLTRLVDDADSAVSEQAHAVLHAMRLYS